MSITARDSGTLLSVTVLWGNVLWLLALATFRHMLRVPKSSSQEEKKKNNFFYFQFSQSSCVPNNVYFFFESGNSGKTSQFFIRKIIPNYHIFPLHCL